MSGVKRFKITKEIFKSHKPNEIANGIVNHSAQLLTDVIAKNGPGLYDISLTKVRNLKEGE